MRRIYASPRMENIERLVAVMAEHGIATRVTNRRVYERPSYSRFSYSSLDDSESWPAVWVARANDHTRARRLMREIGIEPLTRYADDLAAARRQRNRIGPGRHARIAARVRTALILGVCLALALLGLQALSVSW
jgi:hypothetical protein